MLPNDFVWYPRAEHLKSRVAEFMRLQGLRSWRELVTKSCEDTEWFWTNALKDLGVEWFKPYHTLRFDEFLGMPWTKWFLGGKLNITHNCLDRHVYNGLGKKTAILFEADDGTSESVTYKEFNLRVRRCARAMNYAGIRKGDRVALLMRTSIDAAVIMFAAFKLGAVSIQQSVRDSSERIVTRLQQAVPRLLFMHDGYVRGGKTGGFEGLYKDIVIGVPSLQEIVVSERIRNGLAQSRLCVSWRDFLRRCPSKNFPKTEALDPESLALILYSSGTTGTPKAIIHTHGGALAQPVKEIGYGFDCREDDLFFWATDVGWMMWPWELIGALFFGATVLLYEGTHLYPTPKRICEIIKKHRVTIFGFTPAALRQLREHGMAPRIDDISSLRILGSTGSRLDPNTWMWFFEKFGRSRLPIINITGGTEILGCHFMPLPIMPLKPGTVGAAGLGMDVDVTDDTGRSVRDTAGYLVCKQAFPSMTRGFLNDLLRYLDTYFPWGPDMWVHGDIARIDEDGYVDLLGRADDVINRNGVKYDPEELDAAVLSFDGEPHIVDACTIGPADPLMGQKIVCFVVTETNNALSKNFIAALKSHVEKRYGKGGRPDEIHAVSAIPRNNASKTPRKILRAAYEKEFSAIPSGIENIHALEEIKKIGEEVKRLQS